MLISMISSLAHNVQLRLMGISLVLQLFIHKPKYW